MKSKTNDCLGLLLFAILLSVGIALVQADEQPAVSKFVGAWFAPWSEQGGPVIKVEQAATGVVVKVPDLPARIIEVDASHLVCVTTSIQNGKTYDNYFELTPASRDHADLYFWQTEPAETQKLNEHHEKLYRGH
jgi:hypothetical protein